VQGCAFVIVPDPGNREANLTDQKLDHFQVPPPAGNVQDGFAKPVAGVATVLEAAFLVQFLDAFQVVVSNLLDDFSAVGFEHGGCCGKDPGVAVAGDRRKVSKAVGLEGSPCVVGGMDVL